MAKQATIYKHGDDEDASDPLLNPAHLIIGRKAQDSEMAYRFANWATGPSGQKIITNFKKNGEQLYSGAP